ncbi:MAG: histidine phosphatase family protein [Pseudomonadota bacterium]
MHRRTFLAGLLAAAAPTVRAEAAVLSRLAEPNTHAVMRHALAPGTGDPIEFRLRDCRTQRNLDARGRAQARATGELFRAAGVRIDRVLTSQWCRCLDTARLLDLGAVEESPPLNSFFTARDRAGTQTAEVRAILAAAAPDQTFMMVTHFVNVRALTNETTQSGEVLIARFEQDRPAVVLGRVLLPAAV